MFWGNNNHTYKKGCKHQYHLTTKPFPNGFSGIQFGFRGFNRNLIKLCQSCLLNCKSSEDFFSFRCGNGEFSIGRTLPSKVYLSSSEDEDEDDYDEYDEDYLKIYSKKESPQTATTPCAENESSERSRSSCDKKYFKSMRSQSSAVGLECDVTVKCEKKERGSKKIPTKLKCKCDVIKDEQEHEQVGSLRAIREEEEEEERDVDDENPYCPITQLMKDKLPSELRKLAESGASGEAIVCKAEEMVDQVISRAQRTQMTGRDTFYPWILKKYQKKQSDDSDEELSIEERLRILNKQVKEELEKTENNFSIPLKRNLQIEINENGNERESEELTSYETAESSSDENDYNRERKKKHTQLE